MKTSQQGYLMMVAVFLVVMIGFLGLSVAYMVSAHGNVMASFSQGERAFFIAQSGLEKATRFLWTPLLSGTNARLSCSGISGNSKLTGSAFGDGSFTVTPVSGTAYYANTTLSDGLTASATSLSLSSTTGFAARGRISIDKEKIDYAAISGSTLIGLTRGVNNTLAAAHVTGATVQQYLCLLQSVGGIPSVASPKWKRQLQQGVSLQHGWAVGAASASNFSVTEWNQPTELAWTNGTFSGGSTNVASLNSVNILPGGEGWAAGNVDSSGKNFVFLHLTGDTWTLFKVAGAASGRHLRSVSTVSDREAWAVGVRNGSGSSRNYTILKWNGSNWTLLSSSSSPAIPAGNSNNQTLNAVSVIDTNGTGTGDVGFAVGDAGYILEYNGSSWTRDTSPTTQNLQGVFVVSASEAWAVGAAGVILKWNGNTWNSVTSPASNQLNAVSMVDMTGNGIADAGVAVGNQGTAVYYNGGTWSTQTMCSLNTYLGVTLLNPSDAWAAGTAGSVCHWDGSSWSAFSSGVSVQLNDVSLGSFTAARPFSAWQEIFL